MGSALEKQAEHPSNTDCRDPYLEKKLLVFLAEVKVQIFDIICVNVHCSLQVLRLGRKSTHDT